MLGLRPPGPCWLVAFSRFRPETPPSPNQSPGNTIGIHTGLLGVLKARNCSMRGEELMRAGTGDRGLG